MDERSFGPLSLFGPRFDAAMTQGFIPPHGGYRKLLSYQRAEVVYDATVRFCQRYFHRRDRTVDQMVQAARSGKQNIIEASMASGTSKESEIKLTNVARASLEELLVDYRDFLRLRGVPEWSAAHLRGPVTMVQDSHDMLRFGAAELAGRPRRPSTTLRQRVSPAPPG